LGADEATLQAARAALADQAPAAFAVFPENWPAVTVFLALERQWRVLVLPGALYYQGIDYAALPAVMRLLGVPARERRSCFEDLRVIEDAAAPWLNDRPAGR
jgi:hypothetical protein